MKIVARFVSLLAILLAWNSTGFCDTTADMTTALSSLTHDLSLIGGWVNDQLEKSTAFTAGGTAVRPGAVKTFPGFELGIHAGLASGIEKDNALTNFVNTYSISSDCLKMPAFFFNPQNLIQAKMGLLSLPGIGKLDVGAGLSAFQTPFTSNLYGQFSQWQLEARVQPDLPLPLDLSLSLGVGNAKGTYTIHQNHKASVLPIAYNGVDYYQSLDTTVFLSSDWDVTAYYAKLMMSKTLLFLTPYLGVGIQAASGAVNTVVGASGTLSLDPRIAGPGVQQTLGIQSPTNDKPRAFDWRLMAGMQIGFFPFLNLNLAAEYGDNVYAGSMGLILSFL